jgi:flagellar basal body-associated protein FliL
MAQRDNDGRTRGSRIIRILVIALFVLFAVAMTASAFRVSRAVHTVIVRPDAAATATPTPANSGPSLAG